LREFQEWRKIYIFTGFGPVDDQKREFTVDMFLRQKWKDPRLAYQSVMSKSGELKVTHIKSLRKRSALVLVATHQCSWIANLL